MKNFLVVVFICIGMQLSAQNLSNLNSAATSEPSSMIDKLASDQVMKLAKKLNLSESQQQMATNLVITQLTSEKFQKLISSSASKLMGSNTTNNQSDAITKALLDEPTFQRDMTAVLEEKQEQAFNKMIPRE